MQKNNTLRKEHSQPQNHKTIFSKKANSWKQITPNLLNCIVVVPSVFLRDAFVFRTLMHLRSTVSRTKKNTESSAKKKCKKKTKTIGRKKHLQKKNTKNVAKKKKPLAKTNTKPLEQSNFFGLKKNLLQKNIVPVKQK